MEYVIDTTIHIDLDKGLLLVAYVYSTLRPTSGSIKVYQQHIRREIDLLSTKNMGINVQKSLTKGTEVVFLRFIVKGKS